MKFNFFKKNKNEMEIMERREVSSPYQEIKEKRDKELDEVVEWILEQGIKDDEMLCNNIKYTVAEIKSEAFTENQTVYKAVKKIFNRLFFFKGLSGNKKIDIKELYNSVIEHFQWQNEVNEDITEFIKSIDSHEGNEQVDMIKESLEWKDDTWPDFGSANIVIDDIKPNSSIQRSKEIINILNHKDNIIGFRGECKKFETDLRKKVDEINKMTEEFIEQLNKAINNDILF